MPFSPRTVYTGMRSSRYYLYRYGTTAFTVPLPNCASYAYGRTMEIACRYNGGDWSLITSSSNPYWWRTTPTYGNAYQWWSQAGTAGLWTRSQIPQLGAIACFQQYNSDGGHVAVVEKINADGTVDLSMSEYGGQYFKYLQGVTLVQGSRMRINGVIYGYGNFSGYLINPLSAGAAPDPESNTPLIFRRGDQVKIVAAGCASSYGKARNAYGIGWIRYIQKIYVGRPYPYQVGAKSGATTGFYKADALRKIN